MRKLKAFLVLLFSVLMSLCLFACTPAEETPGPDDPDDPGITDPDNPPGETTNQVISAQFQTDDPAITLSEAQVQDEASRLAAVEEAVSEFRIRYSIQGETRPVTDNVSDLKLEYDFSTVDWETVGAYSVTVTLVGAGEYDCGEGVVLSNTLSLSIEHSFGEPVDGSATCEFCGAVMTDVTLEEGRSEKVSIAGFHAGATVDSSSGDLELLTPFGTIEQGGEETEVLTATAGLLRKGMTISLYGTVQHQLDANGEVTAGTDFYDYPNLGIALREFDVSESPFPVASSRYVGGMSVIVRSDGWVLMNGIGDNGNTYGARLLAGLVGGSGDSSNYGSHTSASNTNSFPWDYNNAAPPADTSTWGDWAVYTSGTQADDTTYNNLQEVCYQFTFRNDNVVEIVYTIYGQEGAADSVLTCRIKIPDEYADVSFDTVIHGEYVDMNFNRMVIVEQDMLEELTFNGLGDDAKVNYLAGEVINYADFDGNVKVRYSSSEEGVWLDPDSYSIQVLRGEEWVTLGNSDRLQVGDTQFRIMVRSGSVTLYKELKLGADGFIQSITENNVTEVYGVGESASLGNVGFASNNAADAQVVIAPVGAAVKDPTDQSEYIVLRVYGTFETPTVPADGIAEIVATGEGYFDVKVSTDQQTKTVIITGAQDTPIVIDVTGVTAPVYAVSYSIDVNGTAYDYIPANTGASVTFVYTVETSVYEAASVGLTENFMDLVPTGQLNTTGEPATLWDGTSYTATISAANGVTTLTITVEIPAYAVGGTGSVFMNFYYNNTNNLTTLYYGAPVAAEGSAVVEVGGATGYFTVSGNTLYFVVVDTTNDIQASALTTGDVFMNINAGDASGDDFVPEIINVGSTYNADFSSFDYKDADLAASGAVTATLTPNGTLNTDNAYDYDYNYVLTTAIDLTKYGITSASDFYFEYGKTDDDMHPVHVVVADGVVTITPATLSETAVNIVAGGDCFTSNIDAYPVEDAEGNDLFYGNLTIIPAEHDWESDDGVIFTCSECGAITKSNATKWTITPDMLEGVTETGLTITINTSGVAGDWTSHTLTTAVGNLIITLPNLDPWNNVPEDFTEEEAELAAMLHDCHFVPGVDSLVGDATYQVFYNSTEVPELFTTIVVVPGEEGGIYYYCNGELVIQYLAEKSNAQGGEKTGTVEDFVTLFLTVAERAGLIVANSGVTGRDAMFYNKVLSAEQIAGLYSNSSAEGYYPVHTHDYHADDTTADNYDICACGATNPAHTADSDRHVAAVDDPETTDWLESNYCKVCDMLLATHTHEAYPENDPDTAINDTFFCKYCDEVMPSHSEHDFETDQTAENYGFCDCGTMDPNHVHVYENDLCIVCNAVSPEHEHTFVEGECSVCGAKCAHEFANGTCTLCGGVGSAADVTGVSFDNPVAFNTWWDVPLALEFGETLTISGTQTGAGPANHETVLWEFKEGLTGRMDNWGWTFDPASLNFDTSVRAVEITDVNGNAVKFDWATYLAIVSEDASEWTFEFSWTEEGKVDIVITATTSTGEYAGYTYTNVWSIDIVEAFTGTSFNLHLTAEGITNFTVTSCTVVSYPAAE